MSVLSKLQIILQADTAAYQRNIKKAGQDTKKTLSDAKQASGRMAKGMSQDFAKVSKDAQSTANGIKSAFGGLADHVKTLGGGLLAGFGIAELGRGIITAQREFDVLNAQLITATGSAGNAAAAMKQLQEFAKTTPYGLNQAVEGFAKLKNLGLTASVENLKSFGNTAAAMGKDLMQLIEAVADASTFEFERLKEFGIKANQEKDKVKMTFQGITTEIGKNAQEIEQYLLKIGNNQFATAMATRMQTLDGAISSLGDSWSSFLLALGNANIGGISFLGTVQQAVVGLGNVLDFVSANINDILLGLSATVLFLGRTMIATGVSMAASWVGSMASSAIATTANATSTQRLGAVLMAIAQGHTAPQMAFHRLTTAITAKTTATLAYVRATPAHLSALRAMSVQALATARSFSVLTTAKRASIASATLAGRGLLGIGTILGTLGRIIMAHPIIALGAIIAGVVVHVMGFEKAMQSLSDAFNITKMMLGDLVDVTLDGFVSMLDGAYNFLAGFLGASSDTTNGVSGLFASLFAGTQGGFVGVLQVSATVLDKMYANIAGTIKTAWQAFKAFFNGIRNGFVKAVNAITGAAAGIANAVGGVINQAIDGLNGLIDGAAKIAAKAGIDIGGRITYRASTNWQGKQIAVSADDTTLSLTENIKNSTLGARAYVDSKVVANNQRKVLERDKAQANGIGAVNKALQNNATANDKAGKAAKGKANADKKAKKEADENAKAQQKLAEAIEKQELEWEKLRYEMAHPLNLEIDKINWEIAFGELKDATDEQKAKLIEQAIAIDKDILADDFKKHINDVSESVANVGRDSHLDQFVANATNSWHKFSQIKDELYTANEHGEMLLDNTGKLSQVLNQMADADAAAFAKEMSRANDDITKQLNLGLANNDLERKFLEFESEYNDVLDKYQAHAQMMDTTAYKQIEADAQHNLALKRQLATVEAYRDVVDSLKSEEDKRLETLKSQLNVLTMHSQVMKVNLDIERAKQIIRQSVGLATPTDPYKELNDKTANQYANLDAGLKSLLDNERLTEQERIDIKKWGADERLKIEKAHNLAMNALVLGDAETIFSGLASIAKDGLGEQSRLYRAMFAMQQGFAIAQAGLAMQQAISKGLAKGFPEGLADMAMAVSEGAKIVSAIKSVVMPIGQAHDGIMSVPKSGTWNLEKGERVLPKHTAQNLDKTLNRLQGNGNGGGVVINQTITVNSDGSSDVQTSTELGKRFGDAIKSAIQRELNNERRQGGLLYGR